MLYFSIVADFGTGNAVQIPVHPSNLVITKLHLDKDRKNLIERKQRKVDDKNKGKITEVAPAAAKKD